MRRMIVAAGAALFAAMAVIVPAAAQDHNFPTPGGATVDGGVQMCLNSSGQAVPVSNGTCANPMQTTAAASGAAAAGITAVVSGSAENNHVLKAAPGNLYSVYATNLTGTAGFLVVLNATTAPGDGAITPLDCAPLPGNSTASINYRSGPPEVFSTGIVAVVTSASSCFTKTTGVITAFIHGDVQ